MSPARLPAVLLGLAAAAATAWAQPAPREDNAWPFVVRLPAAGPAASLATNPAAAAGPAPRGGAWTGAGPFLFRQPGADSEGRTASGFRPFWVRFDGPAGDFRAGHFLYPLFSYAVDEHTYRWSVFELIRRWDRRAGAPAPTSEFEDRGELEIFPFWFSRVTGDPADSYRALFPIHGTLKSKLFLERFDWTLFPLYARNERRGAVTTFAPWPIVRVRSGAHRGWGVWPLYDHAERPGVNRETYWLWPFGYKTVRQPAPDAPAGTPPRESLGALPFYARTTGPGYRSEDYAWPFFGTTERTEPKRYSERRYFWPFFVQGRGDERRIDRWAPFYTHSVVKGMDKRWIAWPLVRQAAWDDDGIARTREQFLFFLYWREEQRIAGRANSPVASLTHVWPLASVWDNGAGRRQWQTLSPFDVLFPRNEKVRATWSPLLALARHDQRAPGDTRTSVLWNAVTYEQRTADARSELHVGPLVSVTRQGEARRIAIGRGLVGWQRGHAGGWRMFFGEFPAKHAAVAGRMTEPAAGDGRAPNQATVPTD
jgi:hypothetical protein